jgi:hypothetical protein
VLFSNARGIYLGDPRFTPLFDELQRRRAVVFVHPNRSPDPSAHAPGLPDSLIDYPADTTRAIATLHRSNTFARTPDVKYVLAHAGGTVPYLAGRFGIIDEMNVIPGAQARATAAETFRRLYWDTARTAPGRSCARPPQPVRGPAGPPQGAGGQHGQRVGMAGPSSSGGRAGLPAGAGCRSGVTGGVGGVYAGGFALVAGAMAGAPWSSAVRKLSTSLVTSSPRRVVP